MRKLLERAKKECLQLKAQRQHDMAKALGEKVNEIAKLKEQLLAQKESMDDRRELERLRQQTLLLQRATLPQQHSGYTPAGTHRPTGLTGISGHPG